MYYAPWQRLWRASARKWSRVTSYCSEMAAVRFWIAQWQLRMTQTCAEVCRPWILADLAFFTHLEMESIEFIFCSLLDMYSIEGRYSECNPANSHVCSAVAWQWTSQCSGTLAVCLWIQCHCPTEPVNTIQTQTLVGSIFWTFKMMFARDTADSERSDMLLIGFHSHVCAGQVRLLDQDLCPELAGIRSETWN